MKKGCFVKTIVVLTIFTAVLLYIVNRRFNDVLLNPSKSLIINQIYRDLNYVKETPQKDSLQILIKGYISGVKKIDEIPENTISEFIDTLKDALKDSTIDSVDYAKLYKILKHKKR